MNTEQPENCPACGHKASISEIHEEVLCECPNCRDLDSWAESYMELPATYNKSAAVQQWNSMVSAYRESHREAA